MNPQLNGWGFFFDECFLERLEINKEQQMKLPFDVLMYVLYILVV